MPTLAPSFSALEMEVLDVLGSMTSDSSSLSLFIRPHFADDAIGALGNKKFGDGWMGKCRGGSYPRINATLGRLRNKGMVERNSAWTDHGWGFWQLTDEGVAFLGINTDPDTM